ncbi:hypothetical protein PQR02_27335 [Paraburkholderia sediminicola]|uniref:Uncharacterized protein n=1 Tax=Paraburkholderia rhynchosiae TaxID=487049 RepID=A0ACC7NKY9_9BURK
MNTRTHEQEHSMRRRCASDACPAGDDYVRQGSHGGHDQAPVILAGGTDVTHVHAGGERTHVPQVPGIVGALRDLYIDSSAAAQLGGYGLEVSELQWRALAERTETARLVLHREPIGDADTEAALHRLLVICDYIIELYIAGRECPSAVWREAGKLGREAYGYIDRGVNPKRGSDV